MGDKFRFWRGCGVNNGGRIGFFSRAALDDAHLLDTANGPVFDRCPSSKDHLVVPLEPGKDYRECRVALADLLPDNCFGKKGRWYVEFSFVPDEKEKNRPRLKNT